MEGGWFGWNGEGEAEGGSGWGLGKRGVRADCGYLWTLMFNFGECCAYGFGWWLIGLEEITIESRERITLERGKSVL